MGQVGTADIRAWAVGARTEYAFANAPWQPRLGVQFDAASGDRRPADGTLGYVPGRSSRTAITSRWPVSTGYVNLMHLKPSARPSSPADRLKVMARDRLAVARSNAADAIYVQPTCPIVGTRRRGSNWTGAYGQFRVGLRLQRPS